MAASSTVDWGAIAKILGSNSAQPTNQSTLSKVLNSKALELGVGMVGAGLQARSQGKQAEAQQKLNEGQLAQGQQQMAQNASQFRINTALKLLADQQAQQRAELDRGDAANRNIAASTGLGDEEGFRAKQAFAAAMLPQLRNFSITPGDPAVAAAMPKISGGFTLPEGGLPPGALEAFSQRSTGQAIDRRRGQLDAMKPTGNVEADPNLLNIIQMALEEDSMAEANARMQAESQASLAAEDGTMPNPDGSAPKGYEFDKKTGRLKKKGSSIWGKIGKAALIGGAAVATGLTAGAASPALAAAIGAGAGAGMGAMGGGGWKGALTGAALGGVTGGLGAGAGGVAGNTAAQVAKNAIVNPRVLSQMGAQFVPGTAGTIAQIGTGFLPGPQSGFRRDIGSVNKRVSQMGRR